VVGEIVAIDFGMTSDLQSRLALALSGARAAGELTLRYFQSHALAIDRKRDGSPVTVADREAELLLRRAIERSFPSDAILGEEHGEKPGTSGYRWLLDPIDGTKSFVHGVPLYGTLVGVEEGGVPVLGVIHMPALEETVYGGPSLGVLHEARARAPAPARVSSVARVSDALFCTCSFDYFRTTGRERAFLDLCHAFGAMRGWSDCYAYLLLATGRTDAVIEPGVHPWDVCAVMPIIEAAGGRATDWSGRPDAYTGTSVATNGLIHDEVIGLVEGHCARPGLS